jgi:hypothetical protein
MARDTDHLAGSFETENTGGLLTGFLAEEDVFDRRALWRLGSWGAASVGAVIVAVIASQSSIGSRRDQVAAADLARQSQQIQSVAKESQNETRRLSSAIDTLNGDRDRLYSRVTVLEQGLDSVTGAIARQTAAVSAQAAPTASAATEPPSAAPTSAAAPAVSAVASTQAKTAEKPPTDAAAPAQGPAVVVGPGAVSAPAATPSTPLMASKSIMAPPDAAAGKLIQSEPLADAEAAAPLTEAAAAPSSGPDAPPKVAVLRTEFGVDVGSANSVDGLRALWRGLLKSKSNAALTTLRPIIVVREGSTGLGMQLRLVAGPLNDAAAAAKICAALLESERACETTVFDGQRLAMKADEPAAAATKPAAAGPTKPATVKPAARRRGSKRVVNDDPPKKPDSPSTFSSLFRR